MKFLDDLASRRRFGMKPGLETISSLCHALGDPHLTLRAVHVAGTNGKGAVCAILDAALRASGLRVGRYTSPHLVTLNERFFLDGAPVGDATLERASCAVRDALGRIDAPDVTFFEALTAAAFCVYAEAQPDYTVLETGLGGRLDATNVCCPALSVITRIGLDHCDWLGDTVEKIASEKAGIVKPGVPVVLGRNLDSVRAVVEARAREVGARFVYAPDVADETEIPADFSLLGSFNRENAVTALAALKTLLGCSRLPADVLAGFSRVVWPGRFQRVGNFIVDGAHNPPAAKALVEGLRELRGLRGLRGLRWFRGLRGLRGGDEDGKVDLICGFCGDKDVDEVLRILAPMVRKGYAVRTNNPRSLSSEDVAAKMIKAGIDAVPCPSLLSALQASQPSQPSQPPTPPQPSKLSKPSKPPKPVHPPQALVCGSLFLAGEALVELGAYPWGQSPRFDPAEQLAAGKVPAF